MGRGRNGIKLKEVIRWMISQRTGGKLRMKIMELKQSGFSLCIKLKVAKIQRKQLQKNRRRLTLQVCISISIITNIMISMFMIKSTTIPNPTNIPKIKKSLRNPKINPKSILTKSPLTLKTLNHTKSMPNRL